MLSFFTSTSARAIHQYGQDITPLIVYSKWTQNTIIGMYESEDYGFVSEVLEAAGCKQNSCPYIFVVTFPGVQVAGQVQALEAVRVGPPLLSQVRELGAALFDIAIVIVHHIFRFKILAQAPLGAGLQAGLDELIEVAVQHRLGVTGFDTGA